jgi:predicted DsbA family dithiol-disulfide isomerase
MKQLTVEVWSDIVCPWCGLGGHRLDRALKAFKYRDYVRVVHRAFRVNPDAPVTPVPVRNVIARAPGISLAEVPSFTGGIERLAAEESIVPFIVTDNWLGDTTWAHELVAFADSYAVGDRAWRSLVQKYFGRGASIFDVDSLVDVGVEIGLDATEIREALSQHRFRRKIEADEAEAHRNGISSVPYYRIGPIELAGARSCQELLGTLRYAWDATPPITWDATSPDATSILGVDASSIDGSANPTTATC